MISKLFCLLGLLSLLLQGRGATIVPVVETIPQITFTNGEEGLLTCGYERKPYAVFWGFVSDLSSSDLLLVKHQFFPVGKRSGPGYDEGRFNITDNYSLLIHNVSVEDEGRYICNVADLKLGRVFSNYTNVAVKVQAVRPLVRIYQCGSNTPVPVKVTDNPKASCMIQITSNQPYVQLDCFVEGAKPQAYMSWFDNTTLQDLSNGSSLVLTHGKREGTVNQKLTVTLAVSEFQSDREYYFTCIAEGQAVGGIASVTVGVDKVTPDGVSIALATVLPSMVLVLVLLLFVLLWKKYKRPKCRNGGGLQKDIETRIPLTEGVPDKRPLLHTKRKKIKKFSPNRLTMTNEGTNYINLGVFGLAKAGKSSLINSLIFALTGNYPDEAVSRATTSRESDTTGQIEEIELTDHIHILNCKGMFDLPQPKEILSQIKGQPIADTPKVPVICAIFVCDYRNREGPSAEFMKLLSNDVCSYFGRGIMLVIPNKGDLDGDADTVKTEMADTIGIPEEHVWIFENYTLESHEEDLERSLEFLDFILHCLKVAKGNQQFRNIKKKGEWYDFL